MRRTSRPPQASSTRPATGQNCVGFTKGFVGWEDATASLRQVWKGIPDLHVEVSDLQAGDATAIAHGIVRGTNTGRLYGAPATKRKIRGQLL